MLDQLERQQHQQQGKPCVGLRGTKRANGCCCHVARDGGSEHIEARGVEEGRRGRALACACVLNPTGGRYGRDWRDWRRSVLGELLSSSVAAAGFARVPSTEKKIMLQSGLIGHCRVGCPTTPGQRSVGGSGWQRATGSPRVPSAGTRAQGVGAAIAMHPTTDSAFGLDLAFSSFVSNSHTIQPRPPSPPAPPFRPVPPLSEHAVNDSVKFRNGPRIRRADGALLGVQCLDLGRPPPLRRPQRCRLPDPALGRPPNCAESEEHDIPRPNRPLRCRILHLPPNLSPSGQPRHFRTPGTGT